MRRYLVFILIALFAVVPALSLGSCNASKQADTLKAGSYTGIGEKVTLRFISSWGGVDSKADTLQNVLNGFMKENPQYEVVNESLFGDDFLPKLKTDFASGNDPDVFGLWPGSDIRALIKAGRVADLTEVLAEDKKWKESFGSSMWQYTTFNDRIYGLPVEIIFECLFVNRDLFERYNIKIPGTFDELKQAIAAFRERDIIPVAYNSLAQGTYIYQNIIAALGGKDDVEHPLSGGKINSCYIDAMELMKELYRMGAFPKDAFTLTSVQRNELFKTKKAAMIVQGSWFIGEFRNDDMSVDIVPFPKIKEGKSRLSAMIYGLGCGTFYMSKNAWDNKEKRVGSLKLLKTLTSRDSAFQFAEMTGMLSNVDTNGNVVHYNRLTKKGQEMLESSAELIGPPDSFVDRSVWEGIIVKKFPYVLEGKIDPKAVWDEAIAASVN